MPPPNPPSVSGAAPIIYTRIAIPAKVDFPHPVFISSAVSFIHSILAVSWCLLWCISFSLRDELMKQTAVHYVRPLLQDMG